ncbi:hypothetical protein NliqN6_3309 [Naganishia liquefaciens]|uniref:Uncharacterized protein n=1 Tax=Naganishia liquefaciens TaxID=104408 RepID=A0A8H3YG60_9TREE|nr:hypothetical protein NliqN6_3309 [Naganishia liquefaciens]
MALVQERPQHGRNRPPRMDLQHVLDMTWVEGDPVSTGAATMSEEENGDTQGLAAENNSQRQVLPEDVLHALATLETFRHLAVAGIDDELGLEAGTIQHLARLDDASVQAIAYNDRDRDQDRSTAGQRDRRNSGVIPDVEVNLDGKVPPRATFKSDETMFDIKIEPLAKFIESLTNPDHLEKVEKILEKASTPFDYYRIDERINESYQAEAQADAARSWLTQDHGHCLRVPNVPIIRELRIDITTLHPSAIYRLEQFRRRQLREKVLPVRLDVFVEEKEPEWIKQRMREKRLARKLEKESERVRQLLLDEEERQRRAEERQREQAAMVRRHLGISSARRGRRHSGDSDGSSEMSPVPSDVSSPTPPPTQIFHEVQESVPFPFTTPVQLDNMPNPPDVSVSTSLQLTDLSKDLPAVRTVETGVASSKASGIVSATAIAKKLPRLKLKFKGLTPGISSSPLSTGGPCFPGAANAGTYPSHGDQNVAVGPDTLSNGNFTTASERHLSKQLVMKAGLSPSGASSGRLPDQCLSPKSKPTLRTQEGPPSIPPAAEEVISHMETLLNTQDAGTSSTQNPINVDIIVNLTVDPTASSSAGVRPVDESRLGTTIEATSDIIDREATRAKADIAEPPLYSAQDEEDEAMVEVMGGLDTVPVSGSSGFGPNVEGFSSAGSLHEGKSPDQSPQLAADVSGDFATEVQQDATRIPHEPHSEVQPILLPNRAAGQHQSGTQEAFHISGPSEPQSTANQADFQMLIDDEIEPVTFEDTQAGTWKAIYRDLYSNNHEKGKESTFTNKGKGRAKDLSLQIRAINSSDSDDGSPWDQTANVIQVKGITGPTATDSERPSIQSPDTRSVSPAPLVMPMTQSPDRQMIGIPSQPYSEQTTLGPTAARPSTERRRQNEALYAALAASFLNRCGSMSQAGSNPDDRPRVQAGLASQSLWHSPSSSSRATSDTPSESYLIQRRIGMTTCDPRDVFGRLETVPGALTGTIKAEYNLESNYMQGEVLQDENKDANDDFRSDDEIKISKPPVQEPITSSPELEDDIVGDFAQPSTRARVSSSARFNTSRPIVIEEEEDSEIEMLETTWHRQGRASRDKRKVFPDMIPIEQLDLSPPKRHRANADSWRRRSSKKTPDHVLHLRCDEEGAEDDDDEPIYISAKNLWTDPTNVEVVIPIRRHAFSPTPAPIPRAGPNLKIRLNLGSYRQ